MPCAAVPQTEVNILKDLEQRMETIVMTVSRLSTEHIIAQIQVDKEWVKGETDRQLELS